MLIKYGRFGKFMACSGFPDCKTTKALAKDAPKMIGLKCPKCLEGDVIEKRVTRGRARGKIFWGCNKYPKCDYASWTNPLNPPDPANEGQPATNDKQPEAAAIEGKEQEQDDAPQEDIEKNPES